MTILSSIIWYLTTFFSQSPEEAILLAKINSQTACWNNGDIECFMRDYWKSDSLMYIGKSGVTYGWQQTLDRYKINYPDHAAMGQLQLEVHNLKQLSADCYFMVGSWHLVRQKGNIGGYFSLIWRRVDGNWVIIADHSS